MSEPPEPSQTQPCVRPLNIGRAAWTLIRRFGCPLLAQAEADRRIVFCTDAGNAVSADEWRCVHRKIAELGSAREDGAVH